MQGRRGAAQERQKQLLKTACDEPDSLIWTPVLTKDAPARTQTTHTYTLLNWTAAHNLMHRDRTRLNASGDDCIGQNDLGFDDGSYQAQPIEQRDHGGAQLPGGVLQQRVGKGRVHGRVRATASAEAACHGKRQAAAAGRDIGCKQQNQAPLRGAAQHGAAQHGAALPGASSSGRLLRRRRWCMGGGGRGV